MIKKNYKKCNNVIFFEGSLAKVSDEIPNNDLGLLVLVVKISILFSMKMI